MYSRVLDAMTEGQTNTLLHFAEALFGEDITVEDIVTLHKMIVKLDISERGMDVLSQFDFPIESKECNRLKLEQLKLLQREFNPETLMYI